MVALHRAEMRMVRWMCGVKLIDRLPSKELRERLGVPPVPKTGDSDLVENGYSCNNEVTLCQAWLVQ